MTTGEQAFALRTVHTNNAAGELVVTNYGTGALVEMYTNADNFRDGFFFVTYADPPRTISCSATSFSDHQPPHSLVTLGKRTLVAFLAARASMPDIFRAA